MPSQRTHTAQPRKHARKALPARFDIRNSAFGVSPRQYQVHAVKSIVGCIHQNCGNGNILHTTGSGKTLTSFYASTPSPCAILW